MRRVIHAVRHQDQVEWFLHIWHHGILRVLLLGAFYVYVAIVIRGVGSSERAVALTLILALERVFKLIWDGRGRGPVGWN